MSRRPDVDRLCTRLLLAVDTQYLRIHIECRDRAWELIDDDLQNPEAGLAERPRHSLQNRKKYAV